MGRKSASGIETQSWHTGLAQSRVAEADSALLDPLRHEETGLISTAGGFLRLLAEGFLRLLWAADSCSSRSAASCAVLCT